uniref:Uncharacterized protein n=1 Tax=viral metagenome TaxID=1070528 RepID=A0A6C0JQZ1_9ZZZZ
METFDFLNNCPLDCPFRHCAIIKDKYEQLTQIYRDKIEYAMLALKKEDLTNYLELVHKRETNLLEIIRLVSNESRNEHNVECMQTIKKHNLSFISDTKIEINYSVYSINKQS